MDWQILAALAICAASLLAFIKMGPGTRPADKDRAVADDGLPSPRPAAPVVAKVDQAVLAQFIAAVENGR